MNCKPGDLAIVVRCIHKKNIGGMFRVVSSHHCDPGEWYGETLTAMQTNNGLVAAG